MTTTTTPKRLNPVLIGILVVVLTVVAFALGQRTARTGTSAVVSAESEHKGHDHGEEGHEEKGEEKGHEEGGHGEAGHAEEGVIHFEEAALRLAKLTVEPVVPRPVQTRMSLTGTVEPNLGGV